MLIFVTISRLLIEAEIKLQYIAKFPIYYSVSINFRIQSF